MSLRRNIIANYASQFYVALIGIVILPLYLRYMGPEAYGLVGFFTMLQAWFNLLDIGLTPTVARETARFRAGAIDALIYRRLVRALQVVFLVVAVSGGCGLFVSAPFVARDWLNIQMLALEEVQFAVQIMAIGAATRWMCGFYRAAISGSEQFVWLARYNAFIATLRFIGVLPFLIFIDSSPRLFFSYQLFVALVELGGLMQKTNRMLPPLQSSCRVGWSVEPIRGVLKFSITIAFTSGLWIAVTQTDKLLLSKLLPLSEYGFFSLAVLLASVVLMAASPVATALTPRLARLEAEKKEASFIRLYREATQLVCIIALPIAFTLAVFAEPVLLTWTGDLSAAKTATRPLQLYALGNSILTVGAFPYYMQYAKGDLRLHLLGSVMFLALLMPLMIWGSLNFGAQGAGWVWLGVNLCYFFAWIPIVHHKFAPGLHWRWLGRDVALLALTAGATVWCLSLFMESVKGFLAPMFIAVFIGGLTVLATVLVSSVSGRLRLNILLSLVYSIRLWVWKK